jgi:FKBP-type peptidyl-prolyl cis-trans isomerase (trigger factor)
VSFGADARTEAVAGQTLDVSVKVVSIQANEVPALDDAIAVELGFEGGAKALRADVESTIRKQREELTRNQARANLLQALINVNPFDVPGGMVEQQLKVLLDELRMQQAYRGVDPRKVTFSPEQVADLRMRSEFAVKGGLILEYVSRVEKVDVSDADLEAKYQELADERGQSIEAIRGYFVKEDAVDELKARLLEEKTLDWLLEKAKLVDTDPNAGAAQAKPAKKAAAPKAAAPKAAAKKAAAPKKAAAKKAAPAAEAPAVDHEALLAGAVGAIKSALATGAHDAHLAALHAAELAGKARKGALAAIEARLNAQG